MEMLLYSESLFFFFFTPNRLYPALKIHLRQFHGTRYAAINPAMISAEELEVQKSHLTSSKDSDDDQ